MKQHLPNLVIIGAMKSGTTSLHRYLALHPEIWMSNQKELDFFIKLRNWNRGIDWYLSHFQDKAAIRGEASPGYTNYPYHDGVPQRMHNLIPDAKLIYILRDPLERIISDYLHRFREKSERRSIQEALGGEDTKGYVNRSCYFMQLSQYLNFYDIERILIITQEELLVKRLDTLKRVFRFLQVDESFESREFSTLFHRSRGKPHLNKVGRIISKSLKFIPLARLSPHRTKGLERLLTQPFLIPAEKPRLEPALREHLVHQLESDLHRLRELTGRNFASWSV